MNTSIKLSYENMVELMKLSVRKRQGFALFIQQFQRDYNVRLLPYAVESIKKEYTFQEGLYEVKRQKVSSI